MSRFLYVSGSSDFSAMKMEETGELEVIKNKIINDGLHRIESEDGSICKLLNFGDVDDNFLLFMLNEFCDYDILKSSCIYKLED